MKKYRYLGVSGGRCCVLSSLASFDSLSEHRNEIEANDFVYEDATNWGGSDDIERTLRVKGIRQTGRKSYFHTRFCSAEPIMTRVMNTVGHSMSMRSGN